MRRIKPVVLLTMLLGAALPVLGLAAPALSALGLPVPREWVAPAAAAPLLPSPTSWPLAGSPPVLRGFDPPETRWGSGHRGVDLGGTVGEPVLAAAAGTVSYAGMLAGRGVLVVDHGWVRTTYEPVTAEVPVGARVSVGERIGTLAAGHGDGGSSLHWGLRAGEDYLDPLLLAPAGVGGTRYRLLPARERQAVSVRAEERAAAASVMAAAARRSPAGPHGFRYPVAGPVTSPYGMRVHPLLGVRKLHDGTDFGAACGTPIRAPYAGTVTAAYFDAGYGNRLMLDHGRVDGQRVVSGFNHATSYLVGIGDRVQPGQLVGYVGSTGYSTGCHLHLMVWLDGTVVDPMAWY